MIEKVSKISTPVLLLFSAILFSILLVIVKRTDTPNSKPLHSITTNRIKVNLEPDAEFLECIAIQHKCLYDHLKKNQINFILEDCKDEDYCNNISR